MAARRARGSSSPATCPSSTGTPSPVKSQASSPPSPPSDPSPTPPSPPPSPPPSSLARVASNPTSAAARVASVAQQLSQANLTDLMDDDLTVDSSDDDDDSAADADRKRPRSASNPETSSIVPDANPRPEKQPRKGMHPAGRNALLRVGGGNKVVPFADSVSSQPRAASPLSQSSYVLGGPGSGGSASDTSDDSAPAAPSATTVSPTHKGSIGGSDKGDRKRSAKSHTMERGRALRATIFRHFPPG